MADMTYFEHIEELQKHLLYNNPEGFHEHVLSFVSGLLNDLDIITNQLNQGQPTILYDQNLDYYIMDSMNLFDDSFNKISGLFSQVLNQYLFQQPDSSRTAYQQLPEILEKVCVLAKNSYDSDFRDQLSSMKGSMKNLLYYFRHHPFITS